MPSTPSVPSVPPRPAGIVMIDAHDLGRHLGCYGRRAVPSDALDALAADGVRFANHFCTAPQCSPSRAALYTGRHAHDVGMLGLAHPPFDWRLRPDARHLAATLRDAGWRTVHLGVQHLTRAGDAHVRALGYDVHDVPHAEASVVADRAVAELRSVTGPFFLNVGFEEPHRDAHGGFRDHPPYDARGIDRPPYLPDTPEVRRELAELQGTIGAMDAAVGRIVDAVRARADGDDVWIVITTDHGLAMPRAKASMYDPGIEAALLMRWPAAGLTGGRTVSALTSHVDLVPTVLEGAGLPLPDGLHGVGLGPLLRGETEAHHDAVFAEKTFHTAYEPQRAVRTDRHKLIANLEVGILDVPGDVLRSPAVAAMADRIAEERPPLELYDLHDDPHETRNLVDDPAYREVRDALAARLTEWMRSTNDPLLAGPVASPYRHAAFRALGLPAEPDPYG